MARCPRSFRWPSFGMMKFLFARFMALSRSVMLIRRVRPGHPYESSSSPQALLWFR